jgi:hypothetical protein
MTERITSRKPRRPKRAVVLGLTVTLSFLRESAAGFSGMRAIATICTAGRPPPISFSRLASEIDRNIELYDLSLQAAVDGMKLPDINKINRELRQGRAVRPCGHRQGHGFDPGARPARRGRDGFPLAGPGRGKLSGHDFFQVHVGRPDAGLFISRPWVAPDGQYLIGLSRRHSPMPTARFGGVVAGSMRVSYFHSLFRKLKFGAKDSMTLLSADGTLLMRAPFDIDTIGQSLRKSSVFKQFPGVQTGWYETTSIPRRREAAVRVSADRPAPLADHQRRFARSPSMRTGGARRG